MELLINNYFPIQLYNKLQRFVGTNFLSKMALLDNHAAAMFPTRLKP